MGPRPLVPEEDRTIDGTFRRRLELRPGMPGPWQVAGSSRVPISEMVKLDYDYVCGCSLRRDLKLLCATVPHVVRRRGL